MNINKMPNWAIYTIIVVTSILMWSAIIKIVLNIF